MQNTKAIAPEFLSGGGEMGHLIRGKDWSSTVIGTPESWPHSLKTAVSIVLRSGYPMFVWWGPEVIMFHNDAYLPVLGNKHPDALGSSANQTWSEIWEQIGPLVDDVYRGKNFYAEDMLLYLERKGFSEESYWTFSYSPILGEDGKVGGLFCACNEETKKILRQRRLRTLKDISEISTEIQDAREVCRKTIDILSQNPNDITFSALYLWDDDRKKAKLINKCGLSATVKHLPNSFSPDDHAMESRWALSRVIERNESVMIDNLPDRTPDVVRQLEVESSKAMVLPLQKSGQETPMGVLICGISDRLDFDDEYESFLKLTARQLSTGISKAVAYEEERKRAEALAELDRAKTTFFSNVSHEFRTPLTLMMGPLEEALRDADNGVMSNEEKSRLKLFQRNTMRLYKLVNSLLDFSRIEAGRIQAVYKPSDLAFLTTDLSGSFQSAVNSVGMDLNIDCQPLSEPIYVDVEMWEKIILNLLSNAFKFTFVGSISVTLTEQPESVTLTVEDTGVGIPENELPRVFDRFHRVQNIVGRTHEGTGIGLSLVKELVSLHSGKIEVDSEVGKGSVFTVTIPKGKAHLPREKVIEAAPEIQPKRQMIHSYLEEIMHWRPDQEETNETDPASGEAAAEKSSYVLVADDNADMRSYIHRMLNDKYEVKTVSNGKQALESVQARTPDLVISDVMMPVMDGFEFIQALRQDDVHKLIPVMLVSARAGEEAVEAGLQKGADDYLVKPFSAREFRSRIAAILRFSKMRKEAEMAIQESEERLRIAIQSANMGTWHYDLINDVATSSNRAAELAGYAPGTQLNMDLGMEYIVEEHRPRVMKAFERALDPALGGFTDIEYDIINQITKKRRTIRSVGQTYFNEEGVAYRMSGVVLDITEKRRDKRELELKMEELEQFAYVASHDLQEPLNTIKSVISLIEDDLNGNSKATGYIEFIKASTERLTTLINDLLEHSRIGRSSKLQMVDFNAVLANVISDMNTTITKNKVVINSATLPELNAYPTEIRLLFQNLISNGIKFSRKEEQPVIDISVENFGPFWHFSVSDNGIGIDKKYLEKIFVIFQRLHNSEDFEGTGIGLAHCKKIVELHNGQIWVDSAAGKGSTFHFTIADAL